LSDSQRGGILYITNRAATPVWRVECYDWQQNEQAMRGLFSRAFVHPPLYGTRAGDAATVGLSGQSPMPA